MKKLSVLFLLIPGIISISQAFGQLEKAKKKMELFNFSSAIPLLQKTILQKDPKTLNEAMVLLAECYRRQNDMENAKSWYARAISSGSIDSMNFYYYGQALRSTGDYHLAREMFHHFDSVAPSTMMGTRYEAFCDSAIAWKDNPPAYEIKLAGGLNSRQSDFGPAFYDDGVVFASDRSLSSIDDKKYGWTGNNYLHLFYAIPVHSDDYFGEFITPTVVPGFLNHEYHDGPAALNKAFTEIFINRTSVSRDEVKVDDNNIRTHLLKIFYSRRKNGKWEKPVSFFLNSDKYSVGHPALSPDGRTLYFVSDMQGGFGGTDIYTCTRDADGKWGVPSNMGSLINTFGNEMFPFVADNGDLYFASDGLPGFGGLDLFVSKMVKGKLTAPRNLGIPMNSSYDDFGLAEYKDSGKGLFSSNRPGGAGGDDLYSYNRLPPKPKKVIPILPPPVMITGYVKDKSSLAPLPGSSVFLLDDETGKVLVLKTGADGRFRTQVRSGSYYRIKAEKIDYISDCMLYHPDAAMVEKDTILPGDLLLDKLEVNRKFKLDNIYYNFDKWEIRADAGSALNYLVTIMKENPITVELGSHTDSRGSDDYNRVLSQRRAESAVKYIVSAGIDPSRITAKGYGETQLLNHCKNGVPCTDAEHQVNRRTEFKVTSSFVDKSNSTFNPDQFREGEILDSRFLPEGFFSNCRK